MSSHEIKLVEAVKDSHLKAKTLLCFEAGDVIQMWENNQSGNWWLGALYLSDKYPVDGVKLYFPPNSVEEVDPERTADLIEARRQRDAYYAENAQTEAEDESEGQEQSEINSECQDSSEDSDEKEEAKPTAVELEKESDEEEKEEKEELSPERKARELRKQQRNLRSTVLRKAQEERQQNKTLNREARREQLRERRKAREKKRSESSTASEKTSEQTDDSKTADEPVAPTSRKKVPRSRQKLPSNQKPRKTKPNKPPPPTWAKPARKPPPPPTGPKPQPMYAVMKVDRFGRSQNRFLTVDPTKGELRLTVDKKEVRTTILFTHINELVVQARGVNDKKKETHFAVFLNLAPESNQRSLTVYFRDSKSRQSFSEDLQFQIGPNAAYIKQSMIFPVTKISQYGVYQDRFLTLDEEKSELKLTNSKKEIRKTFALADIEEINVPDPNQTTKEKEAYAGVFLFTKASKWLPLIVFFADEETRLNLTDNMIAHGVFLNRNSGLTC